MLPLVVTVVVNWNRKELTLNCLESLYQTDYSNHKIVVVDNASIDGSAEAIRHRYPGVQLIQADRNLGYTGGNNLGIEWALGCRADFVHLLNNDTTIASDAVTRMVEVAHRDPTIALIGPKILFASMPHLIWSMGAQVDWKHIRGGGSAHLFYKRADLNINETPFETDYLPGCSLLVSRAAVEHVGLLDPRFFAYCEDIDWAWRMRQAGFRVVVTPQACVWHNVSSTAGSAVSPFPIYMLTRNHLLLRYKSSSKRRWIMFVTADVVFLIPLQVCMNLLRLIKIERRISIRQMANIVQAYIFGVKHFFQGKFGYQILPWG